MADLVRLAPGLNGESAGEVTAALYPLVLVLSCSLAQSDQARQQREQEEQQGGRADC
jgi:hypothetical protein